MRAFRHSIIVMISLLIVSTAAWAGGFVFILESALVLDGEYDALAIEVDDCPGGTCQQAGDLEDDLDDLGGELAQLHADVAACGCSNATLDDLLDGLDTKDAALHAIVDAW